MPNENMAAEVHNESACGSSSTGDDNVIEALMRTMTAQTAALNALLAENQARGGQTFCQVLPDLSKGITVFDGQRYGKAAKDWIKSIQSGGILHGWNDNVKLELARTHLKDAAKAWYDAREIPADWSQFEAAFLKTFGKSTSKTELWEKLRNRVQQPKEGLSAYFHEKNKMCVDLELDFDESKEQIVTGLYRQQIKGALLTKFHVDEDALLHDIILLERVYSQESKKTHDPAKSTAERKPEQEETTKDKPNKVYKNWNSKGEPKCFNCNMYGHLSKDCTKPRRTPKPVEKAEVRSISNDEKSGNKYIKDVVLQERYIVKGLVDTGSSVCTISEDTVKKLKLTITVDKCEMYAFGDTTKPAVLSNGKVMASLAVDGVLVRDLELWVVKGSAQLTDVIIGRSFTDQPHVAYVKVNGNIQFGLENEHPFKDLNLPLATNREKIIATENCLVRGQSINFIHAATSNERYVIPVMNSSCSDKMVRKAECVGFVKKLSDNELYEERDDNHVPITKDLVSTGPKVGPTEVKTLLALINEYRDCFAMTMSELGCTNLMKMNIEDSNIPVRSKPYRHSAVEREQIREIVKEWKQLGIVTETDSEYASPVLLVTKRTGEPRLVVDYRRLNAQTIKKNFPLPTIESQFEGLAGSDWFSTLDLRCGYLQVELTEDAKRKTAFITDEETGQFERMMFGLTNSPYEFSRLMQLVLGPLKPGTVRWYLDDILVTARTWEEMCEKLKVIFQRLREAKLTLKLSKCNFGAKSVEYLGFELDKNGIRPGKHKTNAIIKYQRPRNVHEVRRFIGLTSYFRKFVRNYAKRARPLTDLTRKGEDFKWGALQENAFLDLKEALINEPVLKLYNPNSTYTELHCDASSEGLAGMLLQKDNDGQMHVVYYISKKTTNEERNYHSSKLELMAIVYCVTKLRNFLVNIHFVVVTDCQALVYLNAQKTLNPQIARWYYLLQEYDLEIKHRSGDKMAHVDALSRAPSDDSSDTMGEVDDRYVLQSLTKEDIDNVKSGGNEKTGVLQCISEEDYILTIQRSDPELNELIQIIKKTDSERTANERARAGKYDLDDGRLFKLFERAGHTKRLYVIPKTVRKSIAVRFHDLMGHFAMDRVVTNIRERYWFAGMRRYIRRHIAACAVCLLNKAPGGKQKGKLHPIEPPNKPFERLHVDHLGPFMTTAKKNTHLLVVVDGLTKFARLYPVRNTKTKSVINAIDEYINSYGIPKRLISDRGTCFTSREFTEYCEKLNIKHTLNSSQHAQANGQVERANRTVLSVIQATLHNGDETTWDREIKKVERDLNNNTNKTTDKTPFEMIYGFVPRFVDNDLLDLTEGVNAESEEPSIIQARVRERIIREQSKYKERYDRRHVEGPDLSVGDVVFMKRVAQHTGDSTKLQSKYRGPLVITRVLPSDTYGVAQLNRNPGSRRLFATTAHISQLKLYKNHDEEEVETASEENDAESQLQETNEGETPPESDVDVEPTNDESQEQPDDPPGNTNQRRTRTRPKRFDDYVLTLEAEARAPRDTGWTSVSN